ncbi:hypothetical protein ACQY0O_005037 [Thecaphora frezii]
MASQTEWPQSLKDFANRAFAACNDANRTAVSEELRALIFKSFQEGTIHSTDWSKMQLKSLSSGITQKQPIKKRGAPSSSSESFEDLAKKEKRARRFEREQQEFRRAEDEALHTAIASTSLAGRLGSAASTIAAASSSSSSSSSSFANGKGKHPRYANGHGEAGGYGKYGKNNKWASAPPPTHAGFADTEVADPNVIDWDEHTVVGLSTKLEKPYLRLTSAPDPKTVRPLATLQQTLELLKRKWRTETNYAYICDQFKSMRQDLTVQRIKNEFTVKVYEIHARIALEKGDLGEYNQCQSQLRSLYAYNIPGCVMEFLAYRILYLLHTKNRRDVNALMTELTAEHKAEAAVAHALAVRSALVMGNYHAFFKLYLNAPNMNGYVMDHFVERERVNALLVMAKVYRPSLSLSYIASELAFNDASEAHDFLSSHGAALYVDPTPAELAQMGLVAGAAPSKKKKAQPIQVPLDKRMWDAKAALEALNKAMEKYRKVDVSIPMGLEDGVGVEKRGDGSLTRDARWLAGGRGCTRVRGVAGERRSRDSCKTRWTKTAWWLRGSVLVRGRRYLHTSLFPLTFVSPLPSLPSIRLLPLPFSPCNVNLLLRLHLSCRARYEAACSYPLSSALSLVSRWVSE